MNKILLSNFPYPSEQVVFQKLDDPSVQMRIIHGFEIGPLSRAVICPRLATDIMQALLIHDRVAVELHNVIGLVQVFGFANTIKLLQSNCFDLVDHNGFNPVLEQDGSKYKVVFLEDKTPENSRAYLNRIEKRLCDSYPDQKTEVNLLMLQIDRNRQGFVPRVVEKQLVERFITQLSS